MKHPKPLYVTMNVQKDGRINLGTVAHRSFLCSSLFFPQVGDIQRQRAVYSIYGGSIAKALPRCKRCSK